MLEHTERGNDRHEGKRSCARTPGSGRPGAPVGDAGSEGKWAEALGSQEGVDEAG